MSARKHRPKYEFVKAGPLGHNAEETLRIYAEEFEADRAKAHTFALADEPKWHAQWLEILAKPSLTAGGNLSYYTSETGWVTPAND